MPAPINQLLIRTDNASLYYKSGLGDVDWTQISGGGGGGGMAIGGTVTGGTTGSVLFIGAGPVLAQDNPHFFFDASAKSLRLNTTISLATPASTLDVVTSATAQASAISAKAATNNAYANLNFFDAAGAQRGAVGFAGSAVGTTLANRNFLYSPGAGQDWVISDGVTDWFRFSALTGQANLLMAAGNGTSSANHGSLAYSTTLQRFVMGSNAGPAFEVALWAAARSSVALTDGLIPFTDVNYNLNFYDTGNTDNDEALVFNTGKQMGIGIAVPTVAGTKRVTIRTKASGEAMALLVKDTSSHADIVFFDESTIPVQKGAIGWAASATGNSLSGLNFLYAPTAVDWLISDATTNWMRWYCTTNSFGQEMANGSGAAAALANKGKLIYTTTGQKFQVSYNTGGYFDVATYAAAITTGSIMFANGSNQLAHNNANFFWDNPNKRLGIQTATPGYALEVRDNINQAVMWISNAASGGSSAINFGDEAGPSVSRMSVGHGGSTMATTFLRNLNFAFSGTDTDFVFANHTGVKAQFGMTDGSTYMALADGASIAAGAAGQAWLIYNNTSKKLFVALDGGVPREIVII